MRFNPRFSWERLPELTLFCRHFAFSAGALREEAYRHYVSLMQEECRNGETVCLYVLLHANDGSCNSFHSAGHFQPTVVCDAVPKDAGASPPGKRARSSPRGGLVITAPSGFGITEKQMRQASKVAEQVRRNRLPPPGSVHPVKWPRNPSFCMATSPFLDA